MHLDEAASYLQLTVYEEQTGTENNVQNKLIGIGKTIFSISQGPGKGRLTVPYVMKIMLPMMILAFHIILWITRSRQTNFK